MCNVQVFRKAVFTVCDENAMLTRAELNKRSDYSAALDAKERHEVDCEECQREIYALEH